MDLKKDHRTEDNIFILNTLYESRVTKGNAKMYLAFVDFSKFFDTINRDVLFYKLLKYGVSGPVYKVIKSIYSTTKYRVRIDGHLSPNFLATSGVKQGCPMSPILSNIFQNDLHEIFDNGCDPVKAGDICIIAYRGQTYYWCPIRKMAFNSAWISCTLTAKSGV